MYYVNCHIWSRNKRKKYAEILYEHGIEIEGFCDTYKTKNIIIDCGGANKKNFVCLI